MRILCYSLIHAVALAQALAFDVFTPPGWRNTDGNSFAVEPFNIGTNSMRYQQVSSPIAFGILGSSLIQIDYISFRADTTNAFEGFTGTVDLQINLSTTSHRPDQLSTVFADNVGFNDTVVLARTNLLLSSTRIPGRSPQPNDMYIAFSQPFLYDTSAGNLLVDIRTFRGETIRPQPFALLDAVNELDDSVSRVWANSVGASSGIADSLGLVIAFNATAVPEPGTLTLLFCGVAVFGFALRRQAHRMK